MLVVHGRSADALKAPIALELRKSGIRVLADDSNEEVGEGDAVMAIYSTEIERAMSFDASFRLIVLQRASFSRAPSR